METVKIEAGNNILVEWDIRDGLKERSLPLMDPNTYVKVTIKDPDGTEVVTDQDVTKISTGLYRYLHQTTVNSKKGDYVATLKTRHADGVVNRDNQLTSVVFSLI